MKKRTLNFNLAQLDEASMIKMLDDNNAGVPELMSLLEALFEMWTSSLKFSATVVKYGEARHDGFLKTFVENAAPAHGVSPERLAQILKFIKRENSPSPVVH